MNFLVLNGRAGRRTADELEVFDLLVADTWFQRFLESFKVLSRGQQPFQRMLFAFELTFFLK